MTDAEPPADPACAAVEERKVRTARALAGWSIGCTALAAICCAGGTWGIAQMLDAQSRELEAQVDEIAERRQKTDDAAALLDVLREQLVTRHPVELPETLPEAPPKDPWGQPIRYVRQSAGRAVLTSAGPDGRFGSPDDVDRDVRVQ